MRALVCRHRRAWLAVHLEIGLEGCRFSLLFRVCLLSQCGVCRGILLNLSRLRHDVQTGTPFEEERGIRSRRSTTFADRRQPQLQRGIAVVVSCAFLGSITRTVRGRRRDVRAVVPISRVRIGPIRGDGARRQQHASEGTNAPVLRRVWFT